MGCSPDDLPKAMNDRKEWRERVRLSVLAARHDDDDDGNVISSLFIRLLFTQKIGGLGVGIGDTETKKKNNTFLSF